MSARPSGVPWLLIKVRLVVPLDASARYPRVAYINTGPSTVRGSVISKGLGWMDIGKIHHWVCGLDADANRFCR